MSKKYDLIGQRFGQLEVVEKVRINNKIKWKCKCDCGNDDYYTTTDTLTSGKKIMCGLCGNKLSHEKHRVSKIGQKYGKLTIIDEIYNYNGTGEKAFVCNCDCGNQNIIRCYSYQWNEKSSCGCDRRLRIQQAVGKNIDGQRFGRLLVLNTLWDNSPIKVECQCDCGNIVLLNKNDVQSHHTLSCGCLQKERVSESNYVDSSGYISDSGVKILSPHSKNKKNQLLWNCQCGICGNIFQELPARIKNNHVQSCGCAIASLREKFIHELLIENDICFKEQYTLPECKNKYVLRFDFALFDKNDKLISLIEADGQQHFYPVSLFGGEEGFKKTKQRDNIKNTYCKEHNLNLIRLPYYLSNDEVKDIILNIKLA